MSVELEGAASPPRRNGELAFDAPWQSRAFGVTAALVDAEVFSWSALQTSLIAAINTTQAPIDPEAWNDHYWSAWLHATEQLLEQQAAGWTAQIEQRFAALAEDPHRHHRH